MEKVPDKFQKFVQEKQLQIFNNVWTSAVAGVMIANLTSLFVGDASFSVLTETVKGLFPVIVLLVLASLSARDYSK